MRLTVLTGQVEYGRFTKYNANRVTAYVLQTCGMRDRSQNI